MSNNNSFNIAPKAVIFGMSGEVLSHQEFDFFRKTNPLGFILFARNINNKHQIRDLCRSLCEAVGRRDVPILIDQEGGRVCRLRPPLFRACPPASKFVSIAHEQGLEEAQNQVYDNYFDIGEDLVELGINVNCAPVADLLFPFAHDIIGDRSFGDSVDQVVALARSCAYGLFDACCVPIVKHIPGHGRALADSHLSLPVVNTSFEELDKTDFEIFRQLPEIPLAMTAHVEYSAIDDKPATLSKKVIEVIRSHIGYQGVLVSDDLSMQALSGSYHERTVMAFEAGIDIALHCNGDMHQMQEIARVTPHTTDLVLTKLGGLDISNELLF